jgi:hypothetical protein
LVFFETVDTQPNQDMTEQLQTETVPPAPRAKLLDLSLTQLIAGSFAAATAAFLGSRVGWVGTVTGAGIGSVVSAIAASLYTASMTHAREAVLRQKLHTRRDQPSVQNVLASDSSNVHFAPASPSSSVQNAPVRTPRRLLATAGILFALAGAFLTGLQLATGADVTGTSLGRPPSDSRVEPEEGVGLKDPQTTPSTESAATPEPTSPTNREAPAAEPAAGSGITAPSGDPSPAVPTPTETASPDPATPGSAMPTQPTNPVTPTTPAG